MENNTMLNKLIHEDILLQYIFEKLSFTIKSKIQYLVFT